MNIILYISLQACLASFFYCLYQRLPLKDSLFQGRSCCDSCNTILKWYDLIPIVSYVVLKGKCRYCNHKIKINNLYVEIIWIIINLLYLIFYDLSIKTIFISVVFLDFIVITILDIKYQLIYDSTLLILIPSCIYFSIFNFNEHIIAAIFSAVFLVVCNIIKKNSFGGGDIKLCFMIGLLLGSKTMKMMILAILLCGSYCYYLLMFKHYDKNTYIAFAPYLCIATLYYLFI